MKSFESKSATREHKDLVATAFFGAGEREVLDKNTLGIFSRTACFPKLLETREYPPLKLYFACSQARARRRAQAGEGRTEASFLRDSPKDCIQCGKDTPANSEGLLKNFRTEACQV